MHEEVRGPDDFQGRVKRVHELMGQLAHEADGVGAQHRLATGQIQTSRPRIESREELVLDEHARVCEHIEEGGLAGVGVADERHRPESSALSSLALGPARRLEIAKLDLELSDAAHDPTPIDLELSLTRAPRPDPTGLLGQDEAHAPKTREPVPAQSELDLRTALLGVGVLGEDVKDHSGPVDRGPAEDPLEVPLLGRRQLVVEDHRVGIHGLADPAKLLCLAPADVGRRVRGIAALHNAGCLVGTCGVDEQGQLIEARLDLLDRARPCDHPDEHDLLPEPPVDEGGRDLFHEASKPACDRPSSAGSTSMRATRRTGPARLALTSNGSSPERTTSAVPPGL